MSPSTLSLAPPRATFATAASMRGSVGSTGRLTWPVGAALALALPLALVTVGGCQQAWEANGDGETLPPSILGIGIAPDHSVVPLGEHLQFQATGYYSDQSSRDLTDIVAWQTWQSEVLVVSSGLDREGLGTPIAPGRSRIRAIHSGLSSNELQVAVTEAYPTQLTAVPRATTLHEGQVLQLTAEAAFSDGTRGNVSGSVRWVVDRASVATVSGTGRITTRSVGTATIRAIYENSDEPLEAEPVVIDVVPDSVPVEPADIRITSVFPTVTGDTVSWTVDLENRGGSPATGIWVDAWLDRSSPPNAPTAGDAYAVVSLLEPGEQTDVEIELGGVESGSYSSWVLADSLNSIHEGSSGEADNSWGPGNVTVDDGDAPGPGTTDACDADSSETCGDWNGDSDGGNDSAGSGASVAGDAGDEGPAGEDAAGPDSETADLAVTYFEAWAFEDPFEVLYFIDVTNLGPGAAGTFGVGVFADVDAPPSAPSQPDSLIEVTELPALDTAYLSAVVDGAPDPTWWSFVLADVANALPESDEDNNRQEWLVTP